ncbi:hypothetical protein Hanom_Chr05g00437671 [Helianthus anomalus]
MVVVVVVGGGDGRWWWVVVFNSLQTLEDLRSGWAKVVGPSLHQEELAQTFFSETSSEKQTVCSWQCLRVVSV